MIKSMTGYGRAEAALLGRKMTVEMKSVNHRYLEISLRLPGILAPLEAEIKKRIGEQCSRGRVEATLRVDSDGGTGVLRALRAALAEWAPHDLGEVVVVRAGGPAIPHGR